MKNQVSNQRPFRAYSAAHQPTAPPRALASARTLLKTSVSLSSSRQGSYALPGADEPSGQ